MTHWLGSFIEAFVYTSKAFVYTSILLVLVDGLRSVHSLQEMTYVIVSIACTVYLLSVLPDRIGESYDSLYERFDELLYKAKEELR